MKGDGPKERRALVAIGHYGAVHGTEDSYDNDDTECEGEGGRKGRRRPGDMYSVPWFVRISKATDRPAVSLRRTSIAFLGCGAGAGFLGFKSFGPRKRSVCVPGSAAIVS
jgi:hypothetical protein